MEEKTKAQKDYDSYMVAYEFDKAQSEYEKFMEKYKSGIVGTEEVGKTIAWMGFYYGKANKRYAMALKAYKWVSSQFEQIEDDSGKKITSAKATKLAEATIENDNVLDAQIEVQTIDKYIYCLTALQKGIGKEFGQN